MMRSSPQLILALALLFVLAVPASAHADTKVLTAEAAYTMGDGETPSFAEAMALQKAKKMALEQAGTYVESYTKVQNYQLTADEIQTIAGGVLQVEVLERKRELIDDGLRHYIKIKATITTDKITDLAQRIKGKDFAEEYKKLQNEYNRLSKEIEIWKQLVAKSQTGPEREASIKQIQERQNAFIAVQKDEELLFEQLVSGELLVAQSSNALAVIDNLFKKIVEVAHVITFGPSQVIPASGEISEIIVPLTLTASSEITQAISNELSPLHGIIYKNQFLPMTASSEVLI